MKQIDIEHLHYLFSNLSGHLPKNLYETIQDLLNKSRGLSMISIDDNSLETLVRISEGVYWGDSENKETMLELIKEGM